MKEKFCPHCLPDKLTPHYSPRYVQMEQEPFPVPGYISYVCPKCGYVELYKEV